MNEKNIKVGSGLVALIVILILMLADFGGTIYFAIITDSNPTALSIAGIVVTVLLLCIIPIFFKGIFTLQPNEGAVLILFGEYKGTCKEDGWHYTNPFYTIKKISLRSRNLNGEKLKVNDENGNPIEIAAVVVWKVANTAQAVFDVDNYLHYVETQSESALRHLAGKYPYDTSEDENAVSLRGSWDEVSKALQEELQERLSKAGVLVEEARLSHLAYSPEIAAAMLQRQQATAIIAARQKIVEGAVGMVEMALKKLNEKGVVELDEERKAAMVSNLLVVLCGERNTQAVINTGTLYN